MAEEVELYNKAAVERLISDNAELRGQLDAAVTRCSVLLAIAGACLNGTDQVEQIARDNPATGYNASDAWRAAYKIHSARQDETLDAYLKRLRSSLAIKDKALREVEWTWFSDDADPPQAGQYFCPACENDKKSGHSKDCLIAQALSHTTQEHSK